MSGRARFDEQDVVRAATEVFWRHGYAAASIQDLTNATGLSRSSLYQRFTDKEGLFERCLAAYTERVLRRMSVPPQGTARERLASMIRDFLPRPHTKRPPGCLLARSCAELAELPPAGKALVRDGVEKQRLLIVDLLAEGRSAGHLDANVDLEALSWFYLGVMQAVLTLASAGAPCAALDKMIDLSMAAWPFAGST